MQKILLLFRTVKYLKPVQVHYRLYYLLRRKVRDITGFHYPVSVSAESEELMLKPSIAADSSVTGRTFTFLNLSHTFEEGIDWNFSGYGKLWTYNLSYFDYLQQSDMDKERGLELIDDFIDKMQNHKDALEPFPISLRGINWIKFLSAYKIKNARIDDSLYAQYKILMDNIEYHLLGNHLLENGFSLLFGAYYFRDEGLYAKAKEILTKELEEQILDDGAHFELSPMYHQIMLYRLLDCINLTKHNQWMVDSEWLIDFFEVKAAKMLQWLNAMTFQNGEIPLFNDSAKGIAPTTAQLNTYANTLGLSTTNHQPSTINYQLNQSGYRKVSKANYECIIDIGPIGPDYIPGHAHADTFNFELHITTNHQPSTINHQPFIVDTGLSTYETGERRNLERSTAAHNTVEVMGENSSEVWGGFRVAERASVITLEEDTDKVRATHDGYMKKYGITHTREWQFKEDRIIIKDSLSKKSKAIARLHFHPDVTEPMIKKHISIHHPLSTIHYLPSTINRYNYAPAFNILQKALVLEIPFEQELEVTIQL